MQTFLVMCFRMSLGRCFKASSGCLLLGNDVGGRHSSCFCPWWLTVKFEALKAAGHFRIQENITSFCDKEHGEYKRGGPMPEVTKPFKIAGFEWRIFQDLIKVGPIEENTSLSLALQGRMITHNLIYGTMKHQSQTFLRVLSNRLDLLLFERY